MDIADLSALLGEDVTTEANADIWVAAAGEAAARLLGEARRLADGLGCYVHAVVGNEAEAARALEAGADKAHVTLDTNGYLATQRPEFVLLPTGDETLAAQLAQAWEAGLMTGAEGLAIDPETRALLGRHGVYGGEYYLELAITSPVKLATVDPATLPAPGGGLGREGEVVFSDLPAPEPRLRDLGPAESFTPPAWRPLSKAKAIVAVGRGVGGEDGLALARQLTERLGAELAGDASARDLGWVGA
jgi:electron transfer flavoprotein alpha subunit